MQLRESLAPRGRIPHILVTGAQPRPRDVGPQFEEVTAARRTEVVGALGVTLSAISFITPTYHRDIERFALLRESIRKFAPQYRHVAIVHTEDHAMFRDRFGADAGLTLARTSDVLPAAVEHRRRRSRHRWMKAIRKALHGHWVTGWHFQQLTKLYALAACETDAAVFIDSDVFICRPIGLDYFFVGDDLKLFRRRAVNAEHMGFDISSHAVLRNPLQSITQLYDYMFQPTCYRRRTAIRLFEKLNERSAWLYRFLLEPRVSEYHLLGYTAAVIEGGQGYHIVDCNPEDLHYSIRYAEDRTRLDAELDALQAGPAKDFVWIQSSLRVDQKIIRYAFQRVVESVRPIEAPTAGA